MVGWLLTSASVVGFDLWALKTENRTMCGAARAHPVAFWAATTALLWHIWLQPRTRRVREQIL